MKIQIARVSPHQNAKVFGVLMAVMSFVFIVPMLLLYLAFGPTEVNGEPPPSPILALVFPLLYLVFGYLVVAIGSALYNFLFRYVGGIEFESANARDEDGGPT